MEPRDVFASRMGAFDRRHDVVERQRRGIDDARALWAMRQHALGHERACIEAYRAGGDQVAPAQGEKIGGARSRADEMHGH